MTNTTPLPKTKTYWRSQPPERFHDVAPKAGHDPHPMMNQKVGHKHKMLDLRPRDGANTTLTYLSPVVEAKSAASLWNSFQVSPHARSLPFVEALPVTTSSPIIAQCESGLPIERPHAVALTLAILLITLGMLSFKL